MPQGSGAGWGRGVFDMSNIPGLAVALKGVPGGWGWMGHASGVVGASEETVWGGSGLYPWQEETRSLRVSSTSAFDRPTQAGADEIAIVGIDENWDPRVAIVELNGTTPVAVSGSWIRVIRSMVLKSGSWTGTNLGDITVETLTGGDVLSVILAGWGESSDGVMSIPRGYVGIPIGVYSSLRQGGWFPSASAYSDILVLARNRGGEEREPWRVRDRVTPYTGSYRPYTPPTVYPPQTDFEIRSKDATSNTNVFVSISFVVASVDNIPSDFIVEPTIYQRGG